MARDTRSEPFGDESTCADCWHKNQTIRHRHFLEFRSAVALGAHLTRSYQALIAEKRDGGIVGGILDWYATMQQGYAGLADEDGRTLTVEQGWTESHRVYRQGFVDRERARKAA